ncbi:MAG: HD domain-containing protein [Bacilli bacterium]|nr:HD domain-containing protein [Bacilli bacterium]
MKKASAMFLSFIILFLAISCLFISYGKQGKVVASKQDLGEGFSAIMYDNSSGLPTSEANAIAQTKNGFIWIGGYSGLIRYDGNTFERFDSSTGVACVVSLFVDSKDRLWIGTNDSGAALLIDNEFKFFQSGETKSSSIRAISEDDKGNIILGTTLGLYYIDNDLNVHKLDDPLINKEYICVLEYDGFDTIYGVTNDGATFAIKDCKIELFIGPEKLGFGTINTIQPDLKNKSYVYLGNQSNQVYYAKLEDEMKNPKIYDTEELININNIKVYDDIIWVVTDSGVGYFDENDEIIIPQNVPMTNSIDRMMQDHEKNLWFCSSRQGVMKVVRTNFVNVSYLSSLPSLVVNSTYIYDNYLYIASDTGLYIVDENYHKVENEITEYIGESRIRCIYMDSAGYMWLCTYNPSLGLVRYNPDTKDIKSLTQNEGMAANRTRMCIELSNGNIAASSDHGVTILTKEGVVLDIFDADDGLSNLEILTICEMDDGSLLLGSDGDGIYKVSGSRVSRYGILEGLNSEVILRVKRDRNEELYWIITSNSIECLKDGEIHTITDFPYANNFDVFFDGYEHLWVLSSNGIYCVDRSSMINNNVVYNLYDRECGIPSIATANSYSYIDNDGNLYVAASTGVYTFNINKDFGDLGDVIIDVPYITVDDQYYGVKEKEVYVNSNAKRINIYAKAFTYSLYNPRISYYLEGFDEKEIYTNKRDLSDLTYTNLKGGTYTFHLKLLNSLTGEVEEEFTLTIIKEKALTERLLFWVFVAILVAAFIVGLSFYIIKLRTKKLLEKQRENQRLINEMTKVFAKCIDMKDEYTRGHSTRVAIYTAMIAKKIGKNQEEIEKIFNIALLHDIGKISIPDSILNKPGKLDDDEFKVMKSHSQNGYDVLKDIRIAPEISLGAGCHHEKFDGSGYPRGLKGDEIPEVAQIIAIADAFDAMYSTRPYRRQMPLQDVVNEIKRCSGHQFNPKLVEAFLSLVEEGAFSDVSSLNSDNILEFVKTL